MFNVTIDLGGTLTKIGLMENGKVLAYTELDSNSRNGLAPLLPVINESLYSLIDGAGLSPDAIEGLGVAFPGIVDNVHKKVVSTNAKFDDACRLRLAQWASSIWRTDNFCIDNDSRLATIGEWQYGAGRGFDDMVMMTIGTGIGTGVIMDGKPLYGANYMAGSLGGHFVADYHGRRCTCGNIGCVETLASSFFLPQIIAENPLLSDTFKEDRSRHNFRSIFEDADRGDGDALRVRNECMDVWSAAIVTYIHAYDPGIVILGGGIINSSHIILPYIGERVGELAWCPNHEVPILPSELENRAALYGLDHCLKEQKSRHTI